MTILPQDHFPCRNPASDPKFGAPGCKWVLNGSANPIARSRAGRERRGSEKEGTSSKGGQTRADSEVARPALGNIPSRGGQGDEKPVRGGYDSDVGEERGKDQSLGVQQDDLGIAANIAAKVAPAQDR
ncbi:Hypothetical predicted protein [Mytilus galloprovincialis]|uniref:Uncharacterized protein n=1 Tax=Mytilus galloprovincialis TaxID=29158 RepID=A0A8B6BW54_MYTGA|nr:Hypothetical predicted protein [Mytilus galloprovincialis]